MYNIKTVSLASLSKLITVQQKFFGKSKLNLQMAQKSYQGL